MFQNIYEAKAGCFLISEPFLADPSFRRSVVLLIAHDEDGSMGYVLTQSIDLDLSEAIDNFPDFPAQTFLGGPVGQNTLHFIHKIKDLAEAKPIMDGIYCGGNISQLQDMIIAGVIDRSDVLFFVGYSGWAAGQLEKEIAAKSWIVAPENASLIFGLEAEKRWAQMLKGMKGFQHFIHYPVNPHTN
jgi:putative transcriptional regulator